jgi:hypothetical protein
MVIIASLVILPTSAGAQDWTKGLAGLENVRIPDKARVLLGKNGFVIHSTDYHADLADIYADAKQLGQGQFITTDAMLHTSHVFFDYLLRLLEIDTLFGMTETLTDRMLALSRTQYQEAGDPDLKTAARLNIGFFSVAKAQFTPGHAPGEGLEDIVKKELDNIKNHKGMEFRELLVYVPNPRSLDATPFAYEDYSQYVPRGHYTRNEQFQKYFKAMMWYGRIDFKLLASGTDKKTAEIGRKMTLQALLITEALGRDQEAMALWRKIYEPTVYFVGRTEDLTVEDYAALSKTIFPGAGLERLADRTKQVEFINKAKKLRPPKILSGAGGSAADTQGFRFMGQRFIPDSHIFQELVYGAAGQGDKKPNFSFTGTGKPFTQGFIPGVGPTRVFPRGLDVMAVLGSKRALEILREAGDTAYTDYDDQFSMLSKLYGATTPEEWRQNLYWRLLHALLPLIGNNTPDHPQPFQAGPAWRDKELQTALGAWAELRHDTILYAKQSYTGIAKCIAIEPEPVYGYGYVEPAPEVYGRLADMFRELKARLVFLGLAAEGIPQMLEKFETVLTHLREISVKELASQPLSNADHDFIRNFNEVLPSLTRFPAQLIKRITSDTDTRMDIISDVHTDPAATHSVLEEAVGSPADIYVLVRDDRGYRVCRGGVFTYYEFKQPMNNRLTDEQWQQMGRDRNRHPQPGWLGNPLGLEIVQ